MNKIALIVNGHRIGVTYAPRLKVRGYDCVHVQSSRDLPASCSNSFVPNDYIENIIYTGNLDEIIQKLAKYPIEFVLPGNETAVELADVLSEQMGLRSNGTALSEARRNKFKMIEAVKRHGLKTVKHIESDRLDDILKWVKQHGIWPVVLKPLNSAGTDLVFFCFNETQVKEAFSRIYQHKNVLGLKNEAVLVQSFLRGTEFIINTVSLDGRHFLSDIWQYKKRHILGACSVYECTKIFPHHFPKSRELVNYAFEVSNALGIKYGPAHHEIMLTEEGPVLVETGARCMGVIPPDLVVEAIGRSQVDLMLDSYTDPTLFLEKIQQPYKIAKHFWIKHIHVYQVGQLKQILYIDQIKQLPSFRFMDLAVAPGSKLERTVDLHTSPGIIFLMHPDKEVVLQDYRTIRRLEKKMFVTI
ncbi:MAG: ATP-grasp domain-containing protein [Gammaproteobacteria bacterium]|nr:ATP-grasp domain-containing protein [Gammaproteobacteria bacterium]